MKIHIGIDDTDCKKGMCTTYLGVVLKDQLETFAELLELRLVRLNPNIPWKTRGNGAVALSVETNEYDKIVDETLEVVKELSTIHERGTSPGVVIFSGDIPSEFSSFYFRTLHDVVTIDDAMTLAKKYACEVYRFKEGRGVIGALAAIGADLTNHTYEIITYRKPENWGEIRSVDPSSVFEMDKATYPKTFNNIDRETSRILITPRSPCPVLFGIRGIDIKALEAAKDMILPGEPVERCALFKTNQGTDAHLMPCTISKVKPFRSVIVEGTVVEDPRILEGGHVIFTIAENSSSIDCAAYEPTGGFREVAKSLRCGDVVRGFGGVKKTEKTTVNLEKLEVVEVKDRFELKNPICHSCKKRMKSAGNGQGFRCKKCCTTAAKKEKITVKRELKPRLYCVPERAMRHLGKPVL
jgi:tRNA(Ile2)-agmatinylcytidine synthase